MDIAEHLRARLSISILLQAVVGHFMSLSRKITVIVLIIIACDCWTGREIWRTENHLDRYVSKTL